MKMHCLGLALLVTSSFVASPVLAQDEQAIRFAAFGDYGPDGPGHGTAAVAQLVESHAPDFIISLGDNCYDSSPPLATQIGKYYGDWVAAQRFWPSLGNHDFSDACGGGKRASGYRAYFDLPNNERYYDYVRGPVHFFVINSATEPDGKTPTSIQGKWLQGKLAEATEPWKIVYFHHPPYGSGARVAKMRWPFEAWGADVVLSGHAHDYERLHRDDNQDGVIMPYFVSGLGGESKSSFGSKPKESMARYNADYGAMFITATPTTLSFEFRNTSDELIDSYSMSKPETEADVIARHVRKCC